jgi:muramidase (phage lysozyme)
MGLFDDLIPAAGNADGGNPNVPRLTVTPRDVPAVGRQLLDTIAGSESSGYNKLYGGGEFSDFGDHPRQAIPITTGPNAGKTSSAAGRYQFLGSTWDEVKKEAGLPDFSPDSQDRGAWHLANKTYQQKTGRDLAKDLESARGNPNAIAGIGKMLSGTWTSLPGGIEPNRATGSFAQRFDRAAPTEVSAQAKRPSGLFDDLVPQQQAQQQPPGGLPADNGGQFGAPPAGGNFRTAREGIAPPTPTAAQAAMGGFDRGRSFNFSDEIKGVLAAGGLNPENPDVVTAARRLLMDASNPVASLIQHAPQGAAFVKGVYRLLSGDPEAQAAQRVATSQDRSDTADQRQFQPAASVGGELAGALATAPIGGGAGAATLPARIAQGVRIGGITGAIGGAGEGTDLASRATGAATGGVTGAVLGGAGAPVVEGVAQAARLASKPFQAVAQTIRGISDPEAEAARRVVGALQRDVKTAGGPPGLTAPEYAASVNAGGPAAVMDLGGETTRALARSAANTSPEARAALGSTINDRFESQSDRVTGWLNKTFGPSDTGATREALQDAARQANKPAYAKAYQEGDKPLWSNELQRLVGSPDVVEAMKAAAEKGKSRAIVDGFGGFNSSVQVSPSGVVEFTRGKNGQPTYPNLQFWDYTRRALSDAAKQAERKGATEEAGTLKQLAGKLNGELDSLVPSYQQARAGAARFFGAQDASEAGEKFLSSNVPIADARRAYAQMSPPERQLFRESFIQSLTQKIESTGDRRNVLNSIAQSPRARQQMELAMGQQGSREFEAMMRTEGVMDLARGAMGNSTTARQLAEMGMAGGAYGIGGLGAFNQDPASMTVAALMWGAARGSRAVDQRVARKVGEMLASNDTSVLRKGINIVSRSQGMMDALRSFDRAIASGGAQQGRGLVPIEAGAIGRADQNQQDVQRPPGQ